MLPLERQELLKEVKEKLPKWAPLERSLFVGLRGSDAHGTKLESGPNDIDDVDVFVVTVQPKRFYLGFNGYNKKREHWDSAGDTLDILVYDVRKFLSLLANSNPNTVNWLHNREEDYLLISDWGKYLIDRREHFLSKDIFTSLIGYAYGQMKRMTSDQAYEGYMGEKRKRLVDKHGYDVKNAAHCVRLVLSATELARFGTFSTYRPECDLKIIKSIKSGEYSVESFTELYENLMDEFRQVESQSTLPDHVDKSLIDVSMINIISYFGK